MGSQNAGLVVESRNVDREDEPLAISQLSCQLPTLVREADATSTLKIKLKPFLFSKAYTLSFYRKVFFFCCQHEHTRSASLDSTVDRSPNIDYISHQQLDSSLTNILMCLGWLFQLAYQASVQSAPELLNYSQCAFTNSKPPLETAQEVSRKCSRVNMFWWWWWWCHPAPGSNTRAPGNQQWG